MSQEMKSLNRFGLAAFAAPLLALIIILVSNDFLLIDYLHVLSAALWVGDNVFMGIIFYRVMNSLPEGDRLDISRRLLPLTLYFMPSISVVTIASGADLMSKVYAFIPSYLVYTVYALAALLLLFVFGFFVPNSIIIYRNFTGGSHNSGDVIRRSMSNFRIALVQAVVQIAMAGLMAYIVIVLLP